MDDRTLIYKMVVLKTIEAFHPYFLKAIRENKRVSNKAEFFVVLRKFLQ